MTIRKLIMALECNDTNKFFEKLSGINKQLTEVNVISNLDFLIKEIIHSVQKLSAILKLENVILHEEWVEIIFSLLESLLFVITNVECPVETSLLTGTCISFLVYQIFGAEKGASLMICLLCHFSQPSHLLTQMHLVKNGKKEKKTQVIDLTHLKLLFLSELKISGKDLNSHCTYQRFMAEKVQMLKELKSSFVHLIILHGMVKCQKLEMFLESVSDGEESTSLLLMSFNPIYRLCVSSTFQFQAFQLLLSWMKLANELLPRIHKDNRKLEEEFKKKLTIFSSRSQIVMKILDLTEANWESAIHGIPDIIRNIYKTLLDANLQENNILEVEKDDLVPELFKKTMKMSWKVKGKYIVLSSLIPHTGYKKFLETYVDVPFDLLQNMKANYIASAIAQVYKALIADMQQNATDMISEWSTWWLKPISKLMLSDNRLLQQNINNYIVPWSLKTLPQLYDLLLATVKVERNSELGEILLLRIAKQIGICYLDFMEIHMIREKLYHSNENVRLEIFTLLCSSSKRSERVSIEELHLIKEFLIMNLNIDSAPFYQRLIAQMKILLTRIRDSTAAEYSLTLKKKMTFPSKIIHQLEFVEWLVNTMLQNTFPGACYQRRRTCLQVLNTVFEVFIIAPQGLKKKENPSVKTKFVIKWAQENGLWKFFSDESLLRILPCIIDFTDEIRLLATNILQEFFPWPENINTESKGTLNVEALLNHALNLCSSPHVQHCDSGALICRMIFMRYVANKGMVYSFHQQSFKSQSIEQNVAVLNFLENLVYIASFQLDRAKVELLKGASTGPIHGILLALHRCLTDDKDLLLNLYASKSQEVCLLLQNVINFCNCIVKHMLFVLMGKSEALYAPSFEEMGEALESLIPVKENKSEDDDCILSEEFQLLLSCCWHCIKESCFLLSDLVAPILSFKTSEEGSVRIMLQEMADILSLVLLKCRHRGAIEACCIALTKFCRELLSNKSSFDDIPKKLLNEALFTLSNATDTSVTRRSAGLPLLVQAVIAGEPVVQNRKLLAFVLEKLLCVINLPLPPNYNEKTDLPQVHACHILKILVVDSSLFLDIIKWLEHIVPTCVSCFSSKSWAVRNGALQLFGATLPRLCGQKKVKEDESEHNLVSPLELFTHHRTLYTYLLHQLQCTVKQHKKKKFCPELVPLLSLMVKISPENDLQGKSWDLVSSFKPLLLDLLESPIWNVRVLASSVLASFIHPEKMTFEIIELIRHLPDNAMEINCNQIHGTLLTVQRILNLKKNSTVGSQVATTVLNILHRRLEWITSEKHECGIIHALYVDIIYTLHCNINYNFHSLTEENFSINPSKPGYALWKAQHLSQYLKSAELLTLPDIVTQIVNHFSDDQDYVQSYLKFLNSQLLTVHNSENRYDKMQFPWNNILESLINLLHNQNHPSILQQTLELIISLCTNLEIDTKFYSSSWKVQEFEKYLLNLTKKENGISVAAYALTVWSLYLRDKLTNCPERIPLCIAEWISTFHGFSHPRNSENLRLQAAHSVALAGSAVVNHFASQLECDSMNAASHLIMLFEGSLLLLQDEDEEIRNNTALFASNLPHSYHASTIQSSVAITVVCQAMSDMLNSQKSFLQHLWCKLQNFPSTAKVLQVQRTYSKVNLFEQEDINVYAEPICMIHLHSNQFKLALEKLSQENSSLWVETIEMFADNIKNELEETKSILNCTDQHLGVPCLKFTCKPRGFLALTKLQCQTYLLCSQKSFLPSTSKLVETLVKLKEGIQDIEQLVPSLTYWLFADY